MSDRYDHLVLSEAAFFSRRQKTPGRSVKRDNPQQHAHQLVQASDVLVERFAQKRQQAPRNVNPKLIFKLEMYRGGKLDEDHLTRMGLHLLAQTPGKAIIVFPDDPTLNEFRHMLRQHAGIDPGNKYEFLAAIEAFSELTPEDRLGVRLKQYPLQPNEIVAADIELWYLEQADARQQLVNEIASVLKKHELAITDRYFGNSMLVLRAQINDEVLKSLLHIDYVKEVDRRPQPTFEMADVIRLGLSNIDIVEPPASELVGVLIIDSGVMQRHPLIGPVLGDAQAFPDPTLPLFDAGAEDCDEKSGGHGTAVAGIAIYSDLGQCIKQRVFTPTAQLFSARVTDRNNEYNPTIIFEKQLRSAVTYFLQNYPMLKVINISLGDNRLIYNDGYQFRFAATIDELAYEYRDRQIVFIVSSGNYLLDSDDPDQVLSSYPSYLLKQESRVIDPATAALAITVGGLSYGSGRDLQNYFDKDTDRLVAGVKDWPSPFTRTGWGINGAIKPEVVDYAGDLTFSRGYVKEGMVAGVPTTAKDFAPPNGRIFRTVSGTSFSAPRVSNLAAQLFKEFPQASSNLIRALIVDSARIPSEKPSALEGLKPWDDDILKVYGYGQPDFERAKWSKNNAVLLLREDIVSIDWYKRYTIPTLPNDFFEAKGTGYISVTLAFDPPTRHTRYHNYLGIEMDFLLLRNTEPFTVDEVMRAWDPEETKSNKSNGKKHPARDSIERGIIKLKPGPQKLKKGTLQKGIVPISTRDWKYDGNPLILVVRCFGTPWTPVNTETQRFALVVSIFHDNPSVQLYSHIRQQVRAYQALRVRV